MNIVVFILMGIGKIHMAVSYTHLDVYKRQGLNTRYTQDVTIYGNSLNLAERTMPTAEKANAIFRGCLLYTSRCV